MGLVFLTARSQRDDRLSGLAAGADAYLVKPVDVDELDLILHRLLQRHALSTAAPVPQHGLDAVREPWTLQASRAQLLAPSGTTVRLTLTELQLLAELAARQGRPCKHVEMARAMGMLADEWDRHRLEVIVSRLRAKVERETGLTAPIRSVRGVGYAWDCGSAP
ncbi:response regulator transcription factor [Acidovorax sp. JG5]|uniref:response regulator transcription factor n=1 Tax=Acidovorax sp. JG5 TaxID=2822718 RepID=UPI001B3395EC|nr:winged helix-turn-helix domain-containing protein [Acidovorax sp. JG5]MBP3979791.1 response regulator transcription factor [Acidovorax sp. JG5]